MSHLDLLPGVGEDSMKQVTVELLEPREIRALLAEATAGFLYARAENLQKIANELRDQAQLLRLYSDRKAVRIALGDWVRCEKFPKSTFVVVRKDRHPRTGTPRVWGRVAPNGKDGWRLGLRDQMLWKMGDPDFLEVLRRWPETADDNRRCNWERYVKPPKW